MFQVRRKQKPKERNRHKRKRKSFNKKKSRRQRNTFLLEEFESGKILQVDNNINNKLHFKKISEKEELED